MEHETGDAYIRRMATFVRTNEARLAEGGPPRRRRPRSSTATNGASYNPASWFSGATSAPADNRPKPLVLSLDTHRLFYLLIRMEAIGLPVGSLDVRVENASRPMSYVGILTGSTDSDVLSLTSIRTSLSAVSRLSLGAPFWGRTPPKSVDDELKYLYSAFTKLPALSLTAPGPKGIAELANEAPNMNALPLDVFKNVQILELTDIDPRTLLGWDRLADTLWSLSIKRSGLDDISDLFIGAVLDDAARRAGEKPQRRRRTMHGPSRQSSFHSTRIPDAIDESAEDAPTPTVERSPPPVPDDPTTPTAARSPSLLATPPSPDEPDLPPGKWAYLRRLSLSDNALTFLPTAPLRYFTSLTYLDLSSNLLVSVPDGLAVLYNLTTLDLSDNMIDSVLGIYKRLGSITTLYLAHNRLDSLCGLERLMALERVDVRSNILEDSAEAGRLAPLPHISDVSVSGNPFAEYEPDFRMRVFEHFWREGHEISLDGSPAGFYERRGRAEAPSAQMSSSRPASAQPAPSPPVVAVGSPPPVRSPSSEGRESPAVVAAKHKRRKPKRIVDLDADNSTSPPPEPARAASPPPARPTTKHRRSATDTVSDLPSTTETLGRATTKRKSRAARVSASVFEPPPVGSPEAARERDEHRDAEAFRARIEALKSDVGEGWLKMFAEGQGLGTVGSGS
ncbi:hypothetical protein PENSPDRAFT_757704 [Peniophora sp. CONT]|nr:hypothetical protein PENSPDRAFT_757704 [Peniophora sp. CONT]